MGSTWYNDTNILYVQAGISVNIACMRVHVMCMGGVAEKCL